MRNGPPRIADEAAGEVETALGAEMDVDEHDIRSESAREPLGLLTVLCHADDVDALPFEQRAGRLAVPGVVVHD